MSNSTEFQGVSSCYVFKSRLQEYAQKNKFLTPVYETLKEGPAHEPYFRSSVIVNDFKYDSLPGFCNRKAAEQSAAEVALVELAKLVNTDDSIRNPVHESGLCKNLLQEYAQKMNYAVPSYACQMGETRGKGTAYTSTVDIGGIQYIGAAARTKKEAQLKAARTALLAIQSSTYAFHTNPRGNCQLTVLPPIKKTPEPAAAVDITKKSLKPRKNKLKKRWQKKKFPKKNGDQVTTDPTGEASGSTVIGNAETSKEIHAQGSEVVDAHMNDQSTQNVTSANGSGLERLTTEEASGHTLNTNDAQVLGSAALEATMDIDIQATRDVGSANGSGLGRLPTEEDSGHTLNTNDVQALGSAAVEATMDMDIRTRHDVGSANGSGLESLPAEVYLKTVVRYTENTIEIQSQGAAAADAHLDMDIQSTQIGGLANGSGLERMTTGEASANTENTNEIGVAEINVNAKFVQNGGSENGTESGEEILLAEAKLTFQKIKMDVQNYQGFSPNVESENGTGSGLERLRAETNQSTPDIKLEFQNDHGVSQNVESKNGAESGLQRFPAEAERSVQELKMEVQNELGFFQNFELQSSPEIKLEAQNDQGFFQNVESRYCTTNGLQRLPAEAQKSLQEVKMEVQNGQAGFQNSELRDGTASGLEMFPTQEEKRSFQDMSK